VYRASSADSGAEAVAVVLTVTTDVEAEREEGLRWWEGGWAPAIFIFLNYSAVVLFVALPFCLFLFFLLIAIFFLSDRSGPLK
jgi:hypothetical protein